MWSLISIVRCIYAIHVGWVCSLLLLLFERPWIGTMVGWPRRIIGYNCIICYACYFLCFQIKIDWRLWKKSLPKISRLRQLTFRLNVSCLKGLLFCKWYFFTTVNLYLETEKIVRVIDNDSAQIRDARLGTRTEYSLDVQPWPWRTQSAGDMGWRSQQSTCGGQ